MHLSPRPAASTSGLRPCLPPQTQPRQRGASLVEFAIVAVPILLVGLGSIEVARWFLIRHTLNVALLEAARAGSTQNARPQAIVEAFEFALLPLFPAGSRALASQALQVDLSTRSRLLQAAPWRIEVLSPTAESFQDHADPAAALFGYGHLATINSDYQFEQDQRRRAQGWPNGQGPRSNASIFEANTLVLRLRYPHEPLLPIVKILLRRLGTAGAGYGPHAMSQGYLPLVQEINVAMQSHPVSWPWPVHGKIVGPQPQEGKPLVEGPQDSDAAACSSPPCQHPSPTPDTSGSNPIGSDLPFPGIPTLPGPPAVEPDGLAVSADDPACGVTLCCVAG